MNILHIFRVLFSFIISDCHNSIKRARNTAISASTGSIRCSGTELSVCTLWGNKKAGKTEGIRRVYPQQCYHLKPVVGNAPRWSYLQKTRYFRRKWLREQLLHDIIGSRVGLVLTDRCPTVMCRTSVLLFEGEYTEMKLGIVGRRPFFISPYKSMKARKAA